MAATAASKPDNKNPVETDRLTLRAATEADLPAILELMRLSLGEGLTPRSEAFWTWKHLDNPFGPSPVLVAEAPGGQLVGLRVFMRWAWQTGGEAVEAVRAVDTGTHPDWRGRGIFTRLTLALADQLAEEGVPFVFNTPNRFSRPGYLKMGWKLVGRPTLWGRPLRPLHVLKTLARLKLGKADSSRGGAFPVAGVPEAAEELTSPDLDAFLASLPPDHRYATPRTADYLRWRYADIPGYSYHALSDLSEGEGALVIFRGRWRSGLREVSLSEVLVTPTPQGRRRGRALLRRLARTVEADYLVAAGARSMPERAVLVQSGFLPAPRAGLHFTVRELDCPPGPPDPFQLSNWRFSIGDLEVF